MIEFRKSTQADLDYVRANPFEDAIKGYPYMDVPQDNTYTTLFDNVIVAVGGCQVRWIGVAVFWLMLTADCKKNGMYGVFAIRAIRDKIKELIVMNDLARAEAYVRPDFIEAVKMIEFLGFEKECTMKKFFPDKTDAYLYARII